MKKLISLLFVLLLSVSLAFPVFAAENLPRLLDYADVLSDSEETMLSDKLDEISERQQIDVVVLTLDSLEGMGAEEYADDFYDYNGYGFGEERDGILFLISMEERDWSISTRGYAITVFTDIGLDYIAEQVVGDLGKGDYMEAFTAFADLCDDYITQAAAGTPYDAGNLPSEPFPFVFMFFACFAAAFVFALMIMAVMVGQLKSVRSQIRADDYIKSGSMNLLKKNDLFLYRHVDRREKPKDNKLGSLYSRGTGGSTTHRSSSGARHGGRSGRF